MPVRKGVLYGITHDLTITRRLVHVLETAGYREAVPITQDPETESYWLTYTHSHRPPLQSVYEVVIIYDAPDAESELPLTLFGGGGGLLIRFGFSHADIGTITFHPSQYLQSWLLEGLQSEAVQERVGFLREVIENYLGRFGCELARYLSCWPDPDKGQKLAMLIQFHLDAMRKAASEIVDE